MSTGALVKAFLLWKSDVHTPLWTSDFHRLHGSFLTLFFFLILNSLFFIPSPAEAAVLQKPANNLGLVGYWPMNEGTSTTIGDFSTNKNNATLYGTGSTRWVTGKFGKAVTANITNVDYASASSTDALNMGTGDFTVSAWVKTTGYSAHGSSWNMIAAKGNIESSSWTLAIQSTNKVYFTINATGVDAFSTTTIGDNKWHHVVGVREGANMSIYVDGVFEDNGTNNEATVTNTNDITFGVDAKSDFSRTMNGSVDDIRLYNRALTASEVASLYNTGAQVKKQASNLGLVGYWPMNEGTSTTAGDFSGNNNTATFTNNPTWTTGRFGKGLLFNGGSTYASIPTNGASINTGTISFWAKATTTSTAATTFMVNTSGTTQRIYFQAQTNASFNFVLGSDASSIATYNGVVNNQWYFITGTWDNGNASFYVNGNLVGSNPYTALTSIANPMRVGGFAGTQTFNGTIDEVRLYNRALSASEVASLYNTGARVENASQNSQMTDGLVGLWSFNGPDVDATYVYDRSGSANHGYFNGVATSSALAQGKVGQGVLFDAVNDQVWIPAMTNPASTAITVSTWVKLKNHANWYDIVGNSWQAADGTWVLFTNNTPQAVFGVYKSSTQYNAAGCTSAFTLNEWHHLVGTYDGANARSYLDGTLCGTSLSVSTSLYTSGTIKIGELGSAGTLPLNIDEARIYNRVLSAAEVKQLYLLGK